MDFTSSHGSQVYCFIELEESQHATNRTMEEVGRKRDFDLGMKAIALFNKKQMNKKYMNIWSTFLKTGR